MDSIQKELSSRQEEEASILQEKEELDLQLAQAEKVQDAAEETLSGIRQRIQDSQTNMENSKGEIIALLNQRSSIKGKVQRYDEIGRAHV